MIRLSADMRTIAVFYGLATGAPTGVPRTAAASGGPRGGWWGYYLAGFDREWAGRIHLGRITLAAAIECASREGAAEFDFLKGAAARQNALAGSRARHRGRRPLLGKGRGAVAPRDPRQPRSGGRARQVRARSLLLLRNWRMLVTTLEWIIACAAVPLVYVAAELTARWWIRHRRQDHVLPPGLRLRLHIDSDVFPQLERETKT